MAKIKSDYIEAVNGSIVDLNIPSTFHMACCDCGLDHFIIFDIVKNKKLRMTIYRDDNLTEAHRKQYRFDCKPPKRKPKTKGRNG